MHIVLSIPPRLTVATIIGHLKGASSHHVNEQYPEGAFAWQEEYSVFSISESALEKVVGYVNKQKQHHANRSLIDILEITPDYLFSAALVPAPEMTRLAKIKSRVLFPLYNPRRRLMSRSWMALLIKYKSFFIHVYLCSHRTRRVSVVKTNK